MTPRRALWLASAACALAWAAALPAGAQEGTSAGLRLRVTEIAQSVDIARGGERFLTVTVEVSGISPARLRRVQPLRDDFTLTAGRKALPCRWLRGGSVPDDPGVLRFVLGFSMPPSSVKTVSLDANLPRLEGADVLEIRLANLQPTRVPTQRRGPGWSVEVVRFQEQEYAVPALPPKGQFISKAGPMDARVFRKPPPASGVPARAFVLAIRSDQTELYDPTLDVSGSLSSDAGALPLLSALMRRDPSRAVKDPPYGPTVHAEFHFSVPDKGRPTGAVILLHRRPQSPAARPLRIDGLPVP